MESIPYRQAARQCPGYRRERWQTGPASCAASVQAPPALFQAPKPRSQASCPAANAEKSARMEWGNHITGRPIRCAAPQASVSTRLRTVKRNHAAFSLAADMRYKAARAARIFSRTATPKERRPSRIPQSMPSWAKPALFMIALYHPKEQGNARERPKRRGGFVEGRRAAALPPLSGSMP